MPRGDGRSVGVGFEKATIQLPLEQIQLLKPVTDAVRNTRKFKQICTSVREIGLVEPLVVARDRSGSGRYLLLDGSLRLEALRTLGQAEAPCLVSTDDEAFTYNKRINRIAIIQEHRMIRKAIERGVSEARLAAVLDVDVDNIRRKNRLLEGVCPEAATLLEDKHVSIHAFARLKRMLPMRQIEAAELMVAMNKYTISYTSALLAATPDAQLVPGRRHRRRAGVTDEQVALMQRETASLDREFKVLEQTYGADHLDLVLMKGYLARLIGNSRVERYLAQHHKEILTEFMQIADVQVAA